MLITFGRWLLLLLLFYLFLSLSVALSPAIVIIIIPLAFIIMSFKMLGAFFSGDMSSVFEAVFIWPFKFVSGIIKTAWNAADEMSRRIADSVPPHMGILFFLGVLVVISMLAPLAAILASWAFDAWIQWIETSLLPSLPNG